MKIKVSVWLLGNDKNILMKIDDSREGLLMSQEWDCNLIVKNGTAKSNA